MSQYPINNVRSRKSIMSKIVEESESTRTSVKNSQASAQLDHVISKLSQHLNKIHQQFSSAPSESERSSDASSDEKSNPTPRNEPVLMTASFKPVSGFTFRIPRILIQFILDGEYAYFEEILITKRITLRSSAIHILFERKALGHTIWTINPDSTNHLDDQIVRTRTHTTQSGPRSRNATNNERRSIFHNIQQNAPISNFSYATETIKTLDEVDEEVIKPRRLKRMLSSIRQDAISSSDEEKTKRKEEEKEKEKERNQDEEKENSKETPRSPIILHEEDAKEEEESVPKVIDQRAELRRQSHALYHTRNRTIEIDMGPPTSQTRKFLYRKFEDFLYRFHSLVDDEESSRIVYEDEDGFVRKRLSGTGRRRLSVLTIAFAGTIGWLLACFLTALIVVDMRREEL